MKDRGGLSKSGFTIRGLLYGKLLAEILSLRGVIIQPRREGGCDGCARTLPQTAEVHFFVKKINSKKK